MEAYSRAPYLSPYCNTLVPITKQEFWRTKGQWRKMVKECKCVPVKWALFKWFIQNMGHAGPGYRLWKIRPNEEWSPDNAEWRIRIGYKKWVKVPPWELMKL